MRVWVIALSMAAAVTTPAVGAAQESRPSFSEFLAGVRTEALARGIRPEILDEALANIAEPVPTVIERDRAQAETVLSLEAYLTRRLTPALVKSGREALAKHRTLLDEVSARYGVPPEVIVGIWGFESNFGGFSGVRPTIAALATLAWDPRRSTLFRSELFARARNPQPRRHRIVADARLVGRRDGPAAVHAVELSQVRRRLRRRRTARHLVVAARHPGVSRQLPEGRRMGRRSGLGTGGLASRPKPREKSPGRSSAARAPVRPPAT